MGRRQNGTKYASLNPANEEIVGEISQAEVSDVEAAVEAASRAFNAWRLTPAPRRGEILYRVGQLLQERKEQLLAIAHARDGQSDRRSARRCARSD